MFEITAKGRAFINVTRPRACLPPWMERRGGKLQIVRRQAQPLPPA